MTAWPFPTRLGTWAAGLLMLASASLSQAQPLAEPNPSPYAAREDAATDADDDTIHDPNIQQAGCSTCGGGLVGGGHGGCSNCGGGLFAIPPHAQLGTWGTGECGHPCYPGKRYC